MSSIRVILISILSEMEKKRQKGKRDKLEKGSGTPKLDNKFEFCQACQARQRVVYRSSKLASNYRANRLGSSSRNQNSTVLELEVFYDCYH